MRDTAQRDAPKRSTLVHGTFQALLLDRDQVEGLAIAKHRHTLRGAASAAGTREQCVAVRDHVVDLILEHYKANGPETFDGLDRSDVATMVGIPPGLKRETFAGFLAWLANARARLVAGSGLSDTVEKCAQRGTSTHIECWLGARTMEIFQRCPTP